MTGLRQKIIIDVCTVRPEYEGDNHSYVVYAVCCVLTQQSVRHLWSNPAEPHSGGSDEESKPPEDEYSFSQGRQERIVFISHYTCRINLLDFVHCVLVCLRP